MASASNELLGQRPAQDVLEYCNLFAAVIDSKVIRKPSPPRKTARTAEVCDGDECVTLRYLQRQTAVLVALAMAYCSWYGYKDGTIAAFSEVRQLLVEYIADMLNANKQGLKFGKRLSEWLNTRQWAGNGAVGFGQLQIYLQVAVDREPQDLNQDQIGDARIQLAVVEQLMGAARIITDYVRLESCLLNLLQQKYGHDQGRQVYEQLLCQLSNPGNDPYSWMKQLAKLQQWVQQFTLQAAVGAAFAAAKPPPQVGIANVAATSSAAFNVPGIEGSNRAMSAQGRLFAELIKHQTRVGSPGA